MRAKNPRIHATINKNLKKRLEIIAERENISLSRLLENLAKEALDDREDRYLSKLADERAKEDEGKPRISHEEFWEEALGE